MNNNYIFSTLFGSRLYGLNTENSDYDYKSIYLPTIRDIITNNADLTNSQHYSDKNANSETESMSIQKFLLLAKQGQTMAIDMLWAPRECWKCQSIYWTDYILPIRNEFITKNMVAFIGYAKSQAIKYNHRGKNLNNIKKALEWADNFSTRTKLKDIYSIIVSVINNKKREFDCSLWKDENHNSFLVINNIKFGMSSEIKFVKDVLDKNIKRYGKRSNGASNNEGLDFKALSHAFRVLYEIEELITTGKIVFPLKERDFIYKIKTGNIENEKDIINQFDIKFNIIDDIIKTSNFPDKCEIDINRLILNIYENFYQHSNVFK